MGGIIAHALGFYWLKYTISMFGGFGVLPTAILYALFLSISSLQYPLFILINRCLPAFFSKMAVGAALAWVTAELFSIRIFPWYLGHTQLAFTHVAQAADIAGAVGISFLLIWVSEALIRILIFWEPRAALNIPVVLMAITLGYGDYRIEGFSAGLQKYPNQLVALVQANISLSDKHDTHSYEENAESYLKLTEKVLQGNPFVVWPETALMQWIPSGTFSTNQNFDLRKLPSGVPMLVGALTFDSPKKIYNSALAILPSGEVPAPYHKRILMPFGEYTPGTSDDSSFKFLIPARIKSWLLKMNETAGNFTAGRAVSVFEYPRPSGIPLKVSPLICYEDVVPDLARESVNQGAELLANLTNDAWFGDTIAPDQHHLIASFRAIENRRYLLRATNSGTTAVVSPLGKTLKQLPKFKAETLLANVQLIRYKTFYTRFAGPWAPWTLLVIVLLTSALRKRKNK